MKKSLGAKTLATPAPVWVIGSYDKDGLPNIMTASWAGICCSTPPCLTVSLQKIRASYANILARKAYTVSVPAAQHAVAADFVGIVGGKDTNKFAAAGLTAVRSTKVDAPYVGEFPLVIECKLLQTVDLGLHVQFIGEIVDVLADEEVLGVGGMPDIKKIAPFVFNPGDRSYHAIGGSLGPAFKIGLELMKKGEKESI
jgi:flavin reductase (DIM6/NTAB) family NADH-FMN oxidoreductase RutF